MKKFSRYVYAAIAVLIAVIAISAVMSASAAETNVIYISDTGTGDGTSASSPLGPETRVTRAAAEGTDAYKYYYAVDADGKSDNTKKFHFNSVLYQAAEKLASTGGKIVLVGDVQIDYSTTYSGSSITDRDFFMPTHGDNAITITAQNNAKLILTEGAHFSLGGKTTFENMTFATGSTTLSDSAGVKNRVICCYGYETVFGEGIKCVNTDGSTAADYFPSIAGARRYGTNTSDTNVTIKSGTWGHVYGGNRGNSGHTHTGDITINISGGTYLGFIIGGEKEDRALHAGNLDMTISGGTFKGAIYAESDKGVSADTYKANIKIIDGDFSSASVVKKTYGTFSGTYTPNLTLDLTECEASNLDIGYIIEGCDADTVLYPMSWNTDIEVVSRAASTTCGLNKKFDATGLELKLTYQAGSTIYTNEIVYSSDNPYFEFVYDSSETGETKLVCKYAGVEYDSYEITVVANRVIYISDNGTGDGSSPDSPLKAEERVTRSAAEGTDAYTYYYSVDAEGKADSTKKFYYNSVLYQAAEMLAETGGKIVLVGDVTLGYSCTYSSTSKTDRDFSMPDHGDNLIIITSENGAKLTLTEGAHFNFGGYTVMENMTIVTGMTNRYMCCQGNKVVFGEGLTCTNTAGSTAANYHICIAGAHRYSNNQNYDTDVTIKSGTWYDVYGSNRGNAGSSHIGDTKITITGGTFKGVINAGANTARAIHCGDSEVLITGGTFSGDIYACSSVGTGYKNSKSDIKITGGTFGSGCQVYNHYNWTAASTRNAPYLTLDLSECTSDDTQIGYLLNGSTADNIIYPAKWCTSATVVTSPVNNECFLNEDFDATGLVISAVYSNGVTKNVAYSDYKGGFEFEIDNTSLGSKTMNWKYGGTTFKTTTTEVITIPQPELLGAQIGVTTANSGALRFVAEVKKPYGDGITVKDYGFIALNDSYLNGSRDLAFGSIYGINVKNVSGTVFRPESGDLYNGDDKMTFSGIYPDLDLNDYEMKVSAVAYITFEYNGTTYIRYSDVMRKSVLGVANAAIVSGMEPETSKSWIKENVIDAYASYNLNSAALVDSTNADTLRAQVVAAYREAANYEWTPSSDIDLNGTAFTAGTTYYGMPYVTGRKATLSEFKSHINDISGSNVYVGPVLGYQEIYENLAASSTNENTYYTETVSQYLEYVDGGNLTIENFFPGCDYSLIVNAWNTVGTNKAWPVGLSSFMPASGRGTVAVGGYDASVSSSDTKAIVDANGETVMYAAYAACKPGDVLLNVSDNGRSVYVVTGTTGSDYVVVSYASASLVAKSDGYTNYRLDQTYTFSSLYSSGFIPVTISELATGLQTQTTTVLSGFDGETAMKTGVMNGVIESNRQIVSVNVAIKRGDVAIYDETVYYNSASDMNTNRVYLSEFDISDTVRYLVEKKPYVLSVTAEIGKEGSVTLVDYTYTVPAVDYTKYTSYKTFEMPANLEQAAIDHMWEQFNIEWTPEYNFQITGADSFNLDTYFKAGTIYKGVMYSNTRATLNEFEDVLVTSGDSVVMPVDIDGKETTEYGSTQYYIINWNDILGNHCSAAMYHSYQQSSRMYDASRRNPNMRIVGLSDGDMFYEMARYIGDTRSITKLYGAEAMYESYALVEEGDFLYKSARGGGHTRMAAMDAYVVRDANGRIDPEASYVIFIEQTDTLESAYSGNDGISYWTEDLGYDTTWFMEHKYTFTKLFNGNCVIYRPTEYMTEETEQAYVGLTTNITSTMLTSDTGSSGTGVQGVVESNYPLRSVTAEIIDTTTGETVTTAVTRGSTFMSSYSYNINRMKDTLNIDELATGNYKFVLTAAIAQGEVELANVTFTK